MAKIQEWERPVLIEQLHMEVYNLIRGKVHRFAKDADGSVLGWTIELVDHPVSTRMPNIVHVPVRLHCINNGIRKTHIHGIRAMGLHLYNMQVNLNYWRCLTKSGKKMYLAGKFKENFKHGNQGVIYTSGSTQRQFLVASDKVNYMPVTKRSWLWLEGAIQTEEDWESVINTKQFLCSEQHLDFVHMEH